MLKKQYTMLFRRAIAFLEVQSYLDFYSFGAILGRDKLNDGDMPW